MEANAVSEPALVPELVNPHRRNRRPPGETQRRIVELVNAGHSQSEIGRELGITQQAVAQSMARLRKRGVLPPAPPQPNLPAPYQPAGIYETLAGVEAEGLVKARRKILPHIDAVIAEGARLALEATPEDAQKVRVFEIWCRIIFPTIKRTEHTGSGGAPLSILFKGINRGPETVGEP